MTDTRWMETGLVTTGIVLLGWWATLFGLTATDPGDAGRAGGRVHPDLATVTRPRGPFIGAVVYRPEARTTGARHAGASLEVVGRIEIPRARISALIAEGAQEAGPAGGQPGLAVLDGSQDRFYRGLETVKPGDRIDVTTGGRREVYLVDRTAIMTAEELQSSLSRGSHPELTLVAGYPFGLPGQATQRFVVRALATSG